MSSKPTATRIPTTRAFSHEITDHRPALHFYSHRWPCRRRRFLLSLLLWVMGRWPRETGSSAVSRFRMVVMARWHDQPNSPPTSCAIAFLSNTAAGYMLARNVVDKVTAPLPVPPEPVKAIPDLIQAIVGPLIGKDAPKAREEPLDVVRHLVPAGKTVRQDHFRK
jgi:hypothetical protein